MIQEKNILLNNRGDVDSTIPNLYFPRLQINRRGEIVLAISRKNTLTTGVLVGKTNESGSSLSIGTKLCDWEVGGELVDYDGEVTVTFENQEKFKLEIK